MAPPQPTSYGQVIEYIKDRLYLASYTQPPNESTPFPYPVETKRSPHKGSSKLQHGPVPTNVVRPAPVYFTIDDTLLYNAFHADFGPLHIGHLYRFAVHFHEILGDPANSDRAVVFWSRADARSRANAACLIACYMVLIQSWPPHLALAPIAQADPPYMPFRDAGYSQADFVLNIQDVVYGVWKAKEENLVGLKEFNLEEYEKYERVDMGDFNWISPQFLAFASPQCQPVTPISPSDPQYARLPTTIPEVANCNDLPAPFKNVLSHFVQRNIGLVVRLNSELYCPTYFTALDITHIDMIFEDGTCPPLSLVRKFIRLAHDMISKRKGIAVHCKAGLGRTGCLIGAYLIYRHGFTANEIIAFMRFMRPGMVVGPQQHWLHLNQGQFREWWLEDQIKQKLRETNPITPRKASTKTPSRLMSNGPTSTPPNGRRSASRAALGEIDGNDSSSTVNMSNYQDENLPVPTPGQPRKTHRMDARHHPYARSTSAGLALAEKSERPDTEVVSTRSHRQSANGSESEEEYTLRMLAHRRSQSRSPARVDKGRSVSYTTTTTTVTANYDGEINIFDDGSGLSVDSMAENQIWDEVARESMNASTHSRPRTPSSKSGNGNSVLGMRKTRESPRRSAGEDKGKVRKTSGRVGSASGGPVPVSGRVK